MKHNKEGAPVVLYSPVSDQQQGQCDCDCACGLDLSAAFPAPDALDSHDSDPYCVGDTFYDIHVGMDRGRYARAAGVLSFPLEDGWQVNYNPTGPLGVTVLNPQAQQVLAAFEALDPDGLEPQRPGLIAKEPGKEKPPGADPVARPQSASRSAGMSAHEVGRAIDSLLQVGLLRPMDGAPPRLARPAALVAWLQITQACTLDCSYCYIPKRPATMSAEVGRSAVDRLVKMAAREGYTTLKLKYAGGEPTLNVPLIQALHARAVRRAEQAHLVLEEVVLTNGVGVGDAFLDWLVQAGIKLMVSLDGGAEAHDRLRSRREGTGTYTAVVGTVDRAVARGLRPNISITLTALNLDGAQEAVAFALERNLPFNINFYRECSPAWSTNKQGEGGKAWLLMPDPARLLAAMLQVVSLVQSYPAYPLPLTNVLDRTRFDVPHRYPCSAGRDYLVIDTEGGIAPCQMLMDQPWSDVSAKEPLAVLRRQGQAVFQAVEEQAKCRDCTWRMACSGGCPLLHGTALHDGYCQVYQALFPEFIRLEGYRLLACRA